MYVFGWLTVVYRVTVSVLTISGTDCKLVELGAVASETGGQVRPWVWLVY